MLFFGAASSTRHMRYILPDLHRIEFTKEEVQILHQLIYREIRINSSWYLEEEREVIKHLNGQFREIVTKL